jgi:SAM-dependent methyltransferase
MRIGSESEMKQPAEFWKKWWDDKAVHAESDYAVNRCTSVRLDELERRGCRQFIDAVSPKPTDIVLDAGCGTGRNMSVLSPLVKEVVGFDYAERMVERARERVALEKLPNVSVMTGDVTKLQYDDNSFDKVVCASVLQYLDDADCASALRELVRVCKPGGRLIIHLKNGWSLYGLSLKVLRPIARLFRKELKPEFYRSARWHERLIAAAGGVPTDYDGFGILTFVPLPSRVVALLLRCELALPLPKFMKRAAVNYQLTVHVAKGGACSN